MSFSQNIPQNKNTKNMSFRNRFLYRFCELIHNFLVINLLMLTMFVSFLSFSNSFVNLRAFAKNSISGLPGADQVCQAGKEKGKCGFVEKTDNIATLAASIAQIMTYIIGSIAIVFILYGAFQWMIDPEKGAATGKKIIVNALIALVISVAAYGLVATVLQFLNTNSVGDNGNGQTTTQTGTNNGANNNGNTTNMTNTGTNYNNQTNSQNKPEKAQNLQTNQPIQQNNPQNFNNSQLNNNQNNNPKPVVNSTPKNDNQTNPTLEFAFPEIKTPQAPAVQ
jgi:Type IV secretion system pilin